MEYVWGQGIYSPHHQCAQLKITMAAKNHNFFFAQSAQLFVACRETNIDTSNLKKKKKSVTKKQMNKCKAEIQ